MIGIASSKVLGNRLVTGVQLIVPVIFTIMALSIELAIPKVKDEPSLTLDLQPFGNGLTELYYSEINKLDFFYHDMQLSLENTNWKVVL
jgi:hypothetical protein